MISNVEINKDVKLSEHFSLAELTKTSVKTADGNIPSHVHIENLKRVCGWLERLRQRCNLNKKEKIKNKDEPIVINSGYRSAEVNKAVGGAPGSNHLTGCAVDIRCKGIEQAIRYAFILLDIADESQEDFDELFIEKSAKSVWVHFAVRPCENRHKVDFLNKK
ncbi:MAG: hypothetical protein K6E67_04300 [Prevotella sp.]|nr:hypothetical protein [Prevotella sp.]